MTTTVDPAVHPDTPQWFRHWLDNGFQAFKEQNQQEHNQLWSDMESKLADVESGLPARVADLVVPRVLDGVKDYVARDGSSAF